MAALGFLVRELRAEPGTTGALGKCRLLFSSPQALTSSLIGCTECMPCQCTTDFGFVLGSAAQDTDLVENVHAASSGALTCELTCGGGHREAAPICSRVTRGPDGHGQVSLSDGDSISFLWVCRRKEAGMTSSSQSFKLSRTLAVIHGETCCLF